MGRTFKLCPLLRCFCSKSGRRKTLLQSLNLHVDITTALCISMCIFRFTMALWQVEHVFFWALAPLAPLTDNALAVLSFSCFLFRVFGGMRRIFSREMSCGSKLRLLLCKSGTNFLTLSLTILTIRSSSRVHSSDPLVCKHTAGLRKGSF